MRYHCDHCQRGVHPARVTAAQVRLLKPPACGITVSLTVLSILKRKKRLLPRKAQRGPCGKKVRSSRTRETTPRWGNRMGSVFRGRDALCSLPAATARVSLPPIAYRIERRGGVAKEMPPSLLRQGCM
ncbi:hypothetical protein NDU88_005312 [Pleurodeles waltl]|uniref:Uncharacterized protein n=1 Tax=Pleurodeles waltl TaxID=8319 RepID=A0AAV7MBR2_PLEWA|nr:hypothetical protein NDU88_005312 [Pleurodeles waltl]